MKKCSVCKKYKHLSEFYNDKRTSDGKYSSCKECRKIYFLKKTKEERKLDTIKKADYNVRWREKNREHHKEQTKRYRVNIYLKVDKNALDCKLTTFLGTVIKQKNSKAIKKYFNFSLNDFKKHIESLFDKNMSWDNHATYWEIDHIIPKKMFSYSKITDEEFDKCWSLKNLQPLEKNINRRKKTL